MNKRRKSVSQIALHDIAIEFSCDEFLSTGDRFEVLSIDLVNKEVTRLNKELGLHKINKKHSYKNLKRNNATL